MALEEFESKVCPGYVPFLCWYPYPSQYRGEFEIDFKDYQKLRDVYTSVQSPLLSHISSYLKETHLTFQEI